MLTQTAIRPGKRKARKGLIKTGRAVVSRRQISDADGVRRTPTPFYAEQAARKNKFFPKRSVLGTIRDSPDFTRIDT